MRGDQRKPLASVVVVVEAVGLGRTSGEAVPEREFCCRIGDVFLATEDRIGRESLGSQSEVGHSQERLDVPSLLYAMTVAPALL